MKKSFDRFKIDDNVAQIMLFIIYMPNLIENMSIYCVLYVLKLFCETRYLFEKSD